MGKTILSARVGIACLLWELVCADWSRNTVTTGNDEYYLLYFSEYFLYSLVSAFANLDVSADQCLGPVSQ